jgi:MFS family permease
MDTYSISQSQAGERRGGALLLTSSIIAALGSFLFGFDTAVISGTTKALQQLYSLSDLLKGFTVASALIGTLFGALLVGRPSDWWGRRPVLSVLAVLYLVSALGCAWAWDWYSLLFFRWLGGIAVGGASVVSPVYITEIAPARRRGLLVAVSQLNIVVVRHRSRAGLSVSGSFPGDPRESALAGQEGQPVEGARSPDALRP